MATEIDQQFVEYVVKSLVGKPDAVEVKRTVDERGVLLELTVDPEDLGRVIGKRGATAQSLRTLLRALGTKNDARYNLKIIDNGEPRPAASASSAASDSASSASDDTSTTSTNDEDDASSDEVRDVELDTEELEEQAKSEAQPEAEAQDDLASRTRKELADLDDLDV